MTLTRVTSKRLRMALRSPRHLLWAMRYVMRHSPLGTVERHLLRGYALKPNQIIVNITGRCNLRCQMCMQPRGALGDDDSPIFGAPGRELSPDEWIDVVDQAAPARPAFYFSGGEPLLYKGIDRILERIKSHSMIAALVTNATLLERHAERLVEIGVDNITVSIDGPAEIHDAIRAVPGTFDRATAGIDALIRERKRKGVRFPRLKVNCVITPESLPYLEATYEIARRLGADEVNFQHPIFDTLENVACHNRVFPKALVLDAQQTEACRRLEAECYDERFTAEQVDALVATGHRLRHAATNGPAVLFFPLVEPARWPAYYLDLKHPFRPVCAMPWTMMRLQADGMFEPCLHYRVGSVRDTRIWDLWNAPDMRRFRRTLADGGLFPACVRCCYRSY